MLLTGVDILHVPRVAHVLEHHGRRFLERVFTPTEIAYCQHRAAALAARFAAKEAVAKALGVGMRILSAQGIGWHDVEIISSASGRPTLHLAGRALELSHQLQVAHWALSLSHEKEYVVAFVIALCRVTS